MNIVEAQRDLRRAFVGGAPGILISGLVWVAAGLTQIYVGFEASVGVLFVGGLLIFPLAAGVSRFVLRAPAPAKTNPLMILGFESTVVLFAGLFAGFLMLFAAPGLAFAMVAVVAGARYFIFSTMYGERVYWPFGTVLMALGGAEAMTSGNLPFNMPVAFGAAEIAFAPLFFLRSSRAAAGIQ